MALLGIECGTTASRAILEWGNQEYAFKFEPANYRLLSAAELDQVFGNVQRAVEQELPAGVVLTRVAIGMPGVLTSEDQNAVKSAVEKRWPNLEKIWVGNDIDVAFSCLEDDTAHFKCLVISGTGSVCYGRSTRDPEKVPIKFGGHGHVLGDRGSGYSIGLNALRSAFRQWENRGNSPLLVDILKQLKLKTLSDLTNWSLSASKRDIASLATIVAQHWVEFKDDVATEVMTFAVEDLARDLRHLITELDPQEGDRILIGLTGSLFTQCASFAEAIADTVRGFVVKKEYEIRVLDESVRGALNLIRSEHRDLKNASHRIPVEESSATKSEEEQKLRALVIPTPTALSPTEERNPGSKALGKMLTLEAIELMLKEERTVYQAIRKEAGKISQLILRITKAFKSGGRLIYVGAGTSGRLGVLDATECPPTFKTPPCWVQGILAGGSRALCSSVEGAEDSVIGGTLAIQSKCVTDKDVVVGIAASGRTPFVWGALYEAKKSKAFTSFLTFNPNIEPKIQPDILLTINVGPEVLTGSTRLKCGTATKSVLNMLTTLSMVKYGKVLENLMVDLNASNEKLRDRAARIVLTILEEEQPELTHDTVTAALEINDYDIKRVVAEFRSRRAELPGDDDEL